MLDYLCMAIGPNDRYGELNPDYAAEAETNDWERSIPDHDLEWHDWWERQTFKRLTFKGKPFIWDKRWAS